MLLEYPVDDSANILVEVDRGDMPSGLALASPQPGEAAAKASRSFGDALDHLEPVLRTVKERLVRAAPHEFAVEFGIKLGGETGIILAKGTTEVNLKVTMTWKGSG